MTFRNTLGVLAAIGLGIPALSALAVAQSPSFSSPAVMPAQTAPLAVASADFNGDGFPDLAVGNSESQTISIFLGSGNGQFSPGPTINLRSCQVGYLATGKFTGAANPDILAVCPLAGFFVIPNTGKGTFGNPIGTILPQGAWVGNLLLGSIHPAIADFNGDGHLDIALPGFDTSNFSGSWYILLGLGDGSFKGARQIPFVGIVPISVAVGDFNGDGKPDLVSAAYTGITGAISLEYVAGHGEGPFADAVYTPLPQTAGSLLMAADVNGDGKLDVIVSGSALFPNLINIATFQNFQGDSAVTVLLGDGKGNFTQAFHATEGDYMTGAALAEIFAAGTLDLVETTIQANFYQSQLPKGAVSVRPGNGDGTFGHPIPLAIPSSTVSTDVAIADFNGDGKPDIALASFPATSVKINTGLFGDFGSTLNTVLSLLPKGNGEVILNQTVASQFRDVNAASFTTGPVARGSIVSAFGSNLAQSTASPASATPPTQLGGDTVSIKDASGASTAAPLFYVSPGQINFAIPDTVATGSATITVQSGSSSLAATQEIVPVSPGIFSANGLAVGSWVRVVNGVQQSTSLLDNTGAMVPIDVSGGGTFLILYGTGIHNHASPVIATIGGLRITAAYAGAQGVYLGEDQINLQLPAALQGKGVLDVSLEVDGETSNAVKVTLK